MLETEYSTEGDVEHEGSSFLSPVVLLLTSSSLSLLLRFLTSALAFKVCSSSDGLRRSTNRCSNIALSQVQKQRYDLILSPI